VCGGGRKGGGTRAEGASAKKRRLIASPTGSGGAEASASDAAGTNGMGSIGGGRASGGGGALGNTIGTSRTATPVGLLAKQGTLSGWLRPTPQGATTKGGKMLKESVLVVRCLVFFNRCVHSRMRSVLIIIHVTTSRCVAH
jgi:hypothetical protein